MNLPEDFDQYLKKKKISPSKYRQSPEYGEFAREFSLLGPYAFDQRKKFFLNKLRLQYPLENDETTHPATHQKS
ncbi:MAG: hypothetical protein RMM53_01790 [Bacteroidia bacterium]|nr:hypothetical protein [Bacteroidia bacterium]MDW8332925.1 hypothetical protein [Bacteroidia bacterium]